jgi:hypothetical protein
MSFILLSFQVHEKSILIPLLPLTLLMREERALCVALTNVAMFSMFPLLVRDELTLQYIVLVLLWNWVHGPWWRSTSNGGAIRSRILQAGIAVCRDCFCCCVDDLALFCQYSLSLYYDDFWPTGCTCRDRRHPHLGPDCGSTGKVSALVVHGEHDMELWMLQYDMGVDDVQAICGSFWRAAQGCQQTEVLVVIIHL